MANNILRFSTLLFDRLGVHLLLLGLLLVPIKLSLAYAIFIPLILSWVIRRALLPSPFDEGKGGYELSPLLLPTIFPLVVFLLYCSLSSLFGIAPLLSLGALLQISFFSLLILVIFDLLSDELIIRSAIALLVGQTIAGLHSVLEAGFPTSFNRLFLGKVTESGQLSLTLCLSIGVLSYLISKEKEDKFSIAIGVRLLLFASLTFCGLLLIGFSPMLHSNPQTTWILAAVLILYCVAATFLTASRRLPLQIWLCTVVLPVLSCALLVNLKRGPWAGVFIGSIILMAIHARKLLIPAIALILIITTTITPISSRIAESSQHFFISGGRSQIWEIGLELSSRYPLGIGFENSPILREFSHEIPPELRHFHNTPLNVLVETGWPGLLIFLWWMFSLLKVAFIQCKRNPEHWAIYSSIGCAVISWLIAGLVEYNFGDSEVVLILFCLIGMLSYGEQRALATSSSPNASSDRCHHSSSPEFVEYRCGSL